MKGSRDEATEFCSASPECVSAGFFHPNISAVPRAVAWGHLDDWSPDHHQSLTERASSCQGPCLLLSSRVFAATLVCMGACPHVTILSADLCGADWTCIAG